MADPQDGSPSHIRPAARTRDRLSGPQGPLARARATDRQRADLADDRPARPAGTLPARTARQRRRRHPGRARAAQTASAFLGGRPVLRPPRHAGFLGSSARRAARACAAPAHRRDGRVSTRRPHPRGTLSAATSSPRSSADIAAIQPPISSLAARESWQDAHLRPRLRGPRRRRRRACGRCPTPRLAGTRHGALPPGGAAARLPRRTERTPQEPWYRTNPIN
jgi:hypothetical protein